MIGGNAIASGNVRGGLSLRSFSPISDPLAFRGTLGSASLSNYLRDSVSVADVYASQRSYGPAPFYDPSMTAPTVGFLRGNLGLTAGQPQFDGGARSSVMPGLLNYAPPGPVNNQPTRTTPAPGASGLPPAVSPFEAPDTLSTGLFGLTRVGPRGLEQPAYRPEPARIDDPRYSPHTAPGRAPETPPPSTTTATTSRLDLRQRAEPIGAPLDLLLNANSKALLESRRPVGLPTIGEQAKAAAAARPSAPDGSKPPADTTASAVGRTALRDTSMLPGNDVFTDMRLALSLSKNPGAEWWNDIRSTLQEQTGTAARNAQARAAMDAQQFVDRVMKAPIKSFAGETQTPLNEEMLKAEGLLQTGQFYDAATRYEQAHLMDPVNPLPLIGRGHALLAAGDYLSAAIQLTRGFERFPDLARFDVDLRSFLGSGEIIDIRRADIMHQLERHEDPQLRFLLGYLEYFTGDKAHGLENLDKAAETSDFGTIIKRFPDMLRGTTPLPPPKLGAEEPGDQPRSGDESKTGGEPK